MSEALQQAAGERLRRALAALTRTPLTGALAGMVVTAVVQSSSATTVMVIGFVSAGLLELPQAVAVIFGANIGTTVTAQLLAFRVEEMLGLVLFGGFFLCAVARTKRGRQMGTAGCSLRGWRRSRAWWSRWPSARSLRPGWRRCGKSRSGVCCWGWG